MERPQITWRHRLVPLGSLFLLLAFQISPVAAAEEPPVTEAQGGMVSYQNASFTVNYNPNSCQGTVQAWPPEAQAAMNHVADILDDVIANNGLIVVDACFAQQGAGTLASAGPNTTVTTCASGAGSLPVANAAYPVALANSLCGADQNGAAPEIDATVNSTIGWDFCTTNCTWTDPGKYDFVSTVLHELLHGLGWVDNIELNGASAAFLGAPNIFATFLACNGAAAGVCADGQRLMDITDGAALASALQLGSGRLSFTGANARAAFAGESANAGAVQGPFIFAPNPYQMGSSISHWDDDHSSNLGRMMNAATGSGPSSRVVDAITLMSLKDMGWTVLETSDFSDAALSSYGAARHFNASGIVNALYLGPAISFESAAGSDSNDGVTRSAWSNGAGNGHVGVTASRGGCLSAWVDWNGDSSFAGTGEQIFAMRAVPAGSNNLQFNVPAGIFPGTGGGVTLAARFRLVPDWDGDGSCSDQAGIQPAGPVFGGEVEDYRWAFAPDGTPATPAGFYVYLPLVIR